MLDLAWVINSDKGAFFGNAGVSASYILPNNEITLEPKSLAGRRLWVVLRGPENRLFLVVRIKKIEQIIEGYHSGDYLLTPEITASLRLATDYSGAAKYRAPQTRQLSLGVSELDVAAFDSLRALVRNSVQTKLLPPDNRSLSQINLQLLPHNRLRMAQSALRAVISGLTLNQVWAKGNGEKLGAYSNYAYALLLERIGSPLSPDTIEALKASDPLSLMLAEMALDHETDAHAAPSRAPSVDVEFTEIDPDKIYARKFISVDSKFRDLEETLNKTEHAEKVHQAMLKDISSYLLTKGVVPYESGSIDLMFRSGSKLNVFEIKSSNAGNLLAQAAKGAFQLACYLNELIKDYGNLEARLVLHETGCREIQSYAIEVLTKLGIQALIYDPAQPWPKRLHGLQL